MTIARLHDQARDFDSQVVLAKNQQTTCIVIFGCGSCLVQCLLSAIILGSFWWKNRSCLNFLKLQCCGALAGAMAIFIYAVHDNLPESSYAIVAIGLEAFLLVGMSAPVSETLIIYAGLAQVRPGQHFQPTVIAVITGVPTLAVLATELTHKSTGWRHDSWWLICGSGVYNIFLSCATMMFLIFVLLYMGALHKAHALVEENVMKKETIEARTRMLHRAAIVISSIIAMEISSIFYINSTSITLHYVFASLSSLLGFLILICYVVAGELTIFRSILRKFKWKHEREEEITSEPIKICSKNSAEVENDTAPPAASLAVTEPYLEARGIAAGSIDMREFVPEASSSFVKSTVAGTSRFLPEIRIDHTDDINLENYSTSPRKYQDTMSFDPVFASRVSHCVSGQPYPAKTDCCTFREYGKYHEPQAQIFLAHNAPAESSTTSKVLCNAEVESRLSAMPDVTLAVKTDPELLRPTEMKTREQVNAIPDIANTTERKQPDGEEMAPEIMITNCEASGMLDRISHDLDYLLNRTHTADGT